MKGEIFMLFNLVKKIVVSKDNKKKFTNLYLVGENSSVVIPISVKMFRNEKDEIINKSDYILAVNLAVEKKDDEK